MLLLIDNYDSFTYNLYQYLAELGADVCVVRNDRISVETTHCTAFVQYQRVNIMILIHILNLTAPFLEMLE